jgi:hypothetical protein
MDFASNSIEKTTMSIDWMPLPIGLGATIEGRAKSIDVMALPINNRQRLADD